MSNQKLQLTVANLLELIGARHTDTLLDAYAGLCLPSLTSKTKGQLERTLDADTPTNNFRQKERHMGNQESEIPVANLLALIGVRPTDRLLACYAGLCLPSLTSKTKGQLERALYAQTPANKQRHKTRLPRSDRFDDFCVACDNAANIIGVQLEAQFDRLVSDGQLPQATQDRVYHAIQIIAAQLRSLPETLGDELV